MSGRDIQQGPIVFSESNISIGGQDVQFATSSLLTPSINNLALGKNLKVGSEIGNIPATIVIRLTIANLANNCALALFPTGELGAPSCPTLGFEFWREDPFTPLQDTFPGWWGDIVHYTIDVRAVTTPKQLYDLIAPYIASYFTQLEFVSEAAGTGTWDATYRSTFLLGNGIHIQTMYGGTVLVGDAVDSSGGTPSGNSNESIVIGRKLEVGGTAERCIVIGIGGTDPTGIGRNEKDSIVIGSNVKLGSTTRLSTQDVHDCTVIGEDISIDSVGNYRNRMCVIGSGITVASGNSIDGLYVLGSSIDIRTPTGQGLAGGSVVIGEYINLNGDPGGYIGYNFIGGRSINTYGQCNDNVILDVVGGSYRNTTYSVILASGGSHNIDPLPGNWAWNDVVIGSVSINNSVQHTPYLGYNTFIGMGGADFVQNSIMIGSTSATSMRSNNAVSIGWGAAVEAACDYSLAIGAAVTVDRNCRGTLSIGSAINNSTYAFSNRGNVLLGSRINTGRGTNSNIVINACDPDVATPSTLGGTAASATLHMPPQTSFVDNDYFVIPLSEGSPLILEVQRTNSFTPQQAGSRILDLRDEGWLSAYYTWDVIRVAFQSAGFWPGLVEVISSNEVVELTLYHPLTGVGGNLSVENHVASGDFSLTGFSGGVDTTFNILIGSVNSVGSSTTQDIAIGHNNFINNSAKQSIALGVDNNIDGGVHHAIAIGTTVYSSGGSTYSTLIGHTVYGSYGNNHIVCIGSTLGAGSGGGYDVLIGDNIQASNMSRTVFIGKDLTVGGAVYSCIGIGDTIGVGGSNTYSIFLGSSVGTDQGGNTEVFAIGRTIVAHGGASSTIAIGTGITLNTSSTSNTVIGRTITISSSVTNVTVIGESVTVGGIGSIVIGSTSTAPLGDYNLALGYGAAINGDSPSTVGTHNIAIGYGTIVTGNSSGIAIGNNASVIESAQGIAIGYNATLTANAHASTVVGPGAASHTTTASVLGSGAVASSIAYSGVAIGASSSVSTPSAIAIGAGASTGTNYSDAACIAIGSNTVAVGAASITIGANSSTSGACGIALGAYASAGANAMVIGTNITDHESAAIHSFTIKGYNGAAINTFVAIDNPGTGECGISIVYNNGSSVANKVVKGAVSPPSGSILLYVDP